MSQWDWDGYTRAPRRKADHGTKAKSQRGAIGEKWWSKRFVALLESFDMGARLTRGRSYARSGQVMDLEIEAGCVKADVQGSRPSPYQVEIRIPVFSKVEWTGAEEAMAGQAIFLAQLLAGEMPKDIESAFQSAKLSLFPAGTREFKTTCSCPDYANPCKHIAATYYILAEAFDQDPFLIFQWRGRNREELQENLAKFRGLDTPEAAPEVSLLPMEPLDLSTFWTAGELPRFRPTPSPRPDLLLRQLGPCPVKFLGQDLGDLLAELARTASLEARLIMDSEAP